jgi:hypothetical protein
MLIIKFTLKGSSYTWLIDPNWIVLVTFLLSASISIIIRRMINSRKRDIKISNSRGGIFIDQCMDP